MECKHCGKEIGKQIHEIVKEERKKERDYIAKHFSKTPELRFQSNAVARIILGLGHE